MMKENFFETGDEKQDLVQLINFAYDIIEIWNTSGSPYNTKIKQAWLKRAEELGALPSY